MSHQHLFLFGGGPPFTEGLARRFASVCASAGPIALLYVPREGTSWMSYAPVLTGPLEAHGKTDFFHFPLSGHPTAAQLVALKQSAGIVIAGGETERYQQFIVHTPVGAVIQEQFQDGVPVAGFSAGALLAPRDCIIPPIDQRDGRHLFLDGLGLLKDTVVSVHYDTWNESANLRLALMRTSLSTGYGLLENTGVYFKNQRYYKHEGSAPVVLTKSKDV